MFFKQRRLAILTILAFAVLSAGGAAAYFTFYPSLPDPSAADREQLVRWLVLRDLANETPETRRALARRLEEEFGDGADWEAVNQRLSTSQCQQIWDNLGLVLEAWFLDKVEEYSKLPKSDRPAYVDRFLDTLEHWKGVEALQPRLSGQCCGSSSQGLSGLLLQQVEQWQQRADPETRTRIGQFTLAVQTRWLLRRFRQFSALLPLPK